jgi:hypothetical protein
MIKRYSRKTNERFNKPSSSLMRYRRLHESDYDDDMYDVDGYYSEDYMDYMECQITLTLYSFSESVSRIREYIIEEVVRNRDCRKISLHNYKLYVRDNELVDIDGDPYRFDGDDVVDLVVRFGVDANGEYDFNEYGMDEAISDIKRYINRNIQI